MSARHHIYIQWPIRKTATRAPVRSSISLSQKDIMVSWCEGRKLKKSDTTSLRSQCSRTSTLSASPRPSAKWHLESRESRQPSTKMELVTQSVHFGHGSNSMSDIVSDFGEQKLRKQRNQPHFQHSERQFEDWAAENTNASKQMTISDRKPLHAMVGTVDRDQSFEFNFHGNGTTFGYFSSRSSAIRILRKEREVLPAGRFFPDSPLLPSSGDVPRKKSGKNCEDWVRSISYKWSDAPPKNNAIMRCHSGLLT